MHTLPQQNSNSIFSICGINPAASYVEMPDCVAAAVRCLDKVWLDGHRYQKGGILLGDFFSQGVAQLNLFDDNAPRANSAALMDVLDGLNNRHGRGGTVFCGAGYSAKMADEERAIVTEVDDETG